MLEKENSCTNTAPVNTGVYRRNYFSWAAISPQQLCVARHTCSDFLRQGRKEQGGSGWSGSIPTSQEVSDQPWTGQASVQLRWLAELSFSPPPPSRHPSACWNRVQPVHHFLLGQTQLLCQPQGSGSKRPISGAQGGGAGGASHSPGTMTVPKGKGVICML